MIWQNPWAWLGLVAIAIPILIHLLGRDRAPRHSFPSLRFIEIAELPPTRRTRLHDLLLLATRMAILAAAVAALAQPLLLLANRRASIEDRLARAIIVDTSASMSRATASGTRAVDSARAEAKRLANDARTSLTIETASPRSAMLGALGWLDSQRSRRELVIISDFQAGVLDSAAVAAIPSSFGIKGVVIPVRASDAPLDREISAASDAVARVGLADDATSVTWVLGSRARPDSEIAIRAADSSAAAAVRAASRSVGVDLPIDTTIQIAVVFADARDRGALAGHAARVSSPRLIDIVARTRGDSLLASMRGVAASGAAETALSRFGPVVLFDLSGRPIAVAAEDTVGGRHRLLVFSNDDAGSVRSAALVAALRRALSIAPPAGELDPSTIPTAVIASWQRPPSATPTRETVDSANGPSDARWLWLLALALLGVEAWLRRERRAAAVNLVERVHDRAA
jgi:hypothetical protein